MTSQREQMHAVLSYGVDVVQLKEVVDGRHVGLQPLPSPNVTPLPDPCDVRYGPRGRRFKQGADVLRVVAEPGEQYSFLL